ncbi:hypothetical protein IJ103_03390 [Candidatus Saccharibacteria bacterium]|nr:hypothetical protein [Candidatus Saccharibacteria bacterium]MBQ9017253.1 hypothetical protein [Candidatus Saccharibacteria bacterium]
MVCIAAFIILIIVGVFVAFLSIFKRDLGRKYLKVLKKSWHCFTRHITFRKCDTSFQDDVKTALLKKVVLKKPEAVKPLSIMIEIASVLIVLVTAWSLIEGVKAGLAIWTLGTCNVSHPASCALGAESCSIDEEDLNWFSEWGEIFAAIPDRLKTWNAEDYLVTPVESINELALSDYELEGTPSALDIMDPGCTVCLSSFRNQLKDTEFLKNHIVYIMLYVIENPDGTPKFKNSDLLTNYYYALLLKDAEAGKGDDSTYADLSLKLLNRLYTESSPSHQNWQYLFNNEYDAATAEATLKSWLKEWGLKDAQIKSVAEKATSDDVKAHIAKIRTMIEEQIKPKGIPTLIYDGKKHLGLYKN